MRFHLLTVAVVLFAAGPLSADGQLPPVTILAPKQHVNRWWRWLIGGDEATLGSRPTVSGADFLFLRPDAELLFEEFSRPVASYARVFSGLPGPSVTDLNSWRTWRRMTNGLQSMRDGEPSNALFFEHVPQYHFGQDPVFPPNVLDAYQLQRNIDRDRELVLAAALTPPGVRLKPVLPCIGLVPTFMDEVNREEGNRHLPTRFVTPANRPIAESGQQQP
jgi:hypothetical protein